MALNSTKKQWEFQANPTVLKTIISSPKDNKLFLGFADFVRLREEARENRGTGKLTENWIINTGFFTNIDRMQDRVSLELLDELPKLDKAEQKIALIACLRFLQSPRGGAARLANLIAQTDGIRVIIEHLERDTPDVVAGFMTYHSVLSKDKLAHVLRQGCCGHLVKSFEEDAFPTLVQV